MNTRKKSMLMLAVGALIIVMAVGYAAASTMLSITGTANVNATWNVAITGVDEGTATGSAKNNSTPSFTGTTASFDFTFLKPGDEIQYNVTVTNNGTIDAYLLDVTSPLEYRDNQLEKTTTGIDGLSKYYTGIKKDDVLKAGESKTISVVYRLDNSVIETDTAFESKMQFVLYFGQSKQKNKTYKTNDIVVLSDDNKYRVLKDNEDTITVIKETSIDDLSIYDSTYSVEGVKNYLNTTYKESLDTELSDKIVGNIEVPNYMDYDDSSKSDNDTKYISGFLNNVVSNCYRYQGTAGSGMNCDLGWITSKYYNGKELSVYSDDTSSSKSINIQFDNVYMTIDGTVSVNDATICDETGKFTSEKTNFEINNTIPLTGNLFYLSDENGTITMENLPHNNITIYNNKVYESHLEGKVGVKERAGTLEEYNPEHLYLYPVMTVKKSAIK